MMRPVNRAWKICAAISVMEAMNTAMSQGACRLARHFSPLPFATVQFDDSSHLFKGVFVIDDIDDEISISMLAKFPDLGAVLPDDDYPLVQRGYRFIVVQPYLVFYRVVDKVVVIHRILHGRRDYLRELFVQ